MEKLCNHSQYRNLCTKHGAQNPNRKKSLAGLLNLSQALFWNLMNQTVYTLEINEFYLKFFFLDCKGI